MNYLKIQNDGILDIRLIALMGGTTKSEDSKQIGQFGTGLKYVLAYVFRNEIDFKVYLGKKEAKFSVEQEVIADETFNIICIDRNRTSITTRMGMDWDAWMIVREIYSNALDEGGESYEVTDGIGGEPGKTSFYLELTPEIMEVYNNWSSYFIVGNIPLFENDKFAVHPSGKTMKMYKHGILIDQDKKKSVFNYDIKGAAINELREYKGWKPSDVFNCIRYLDKRGIEYFLERVTDDHYEGEMDYDWYGDFGSQWLEAIGSAKIIHKSAVDDIVARGLDIDISSVLIVPKKLYTLLTKKFEGIGALRVAKAIGEFYEIVNKDLELKVKQCLAILETAGYFIDPELEYIFGVFGDKSTLAKVDIDSKTIYISDKHREMPMFDTCAMLIEENEHFQTGFQDCSRPFQQHFIDLYTKALFDKKDIKL